MGQQAGAHQAAGRGGVSGGAASVGVGLVGPDARLAEGRQQPELVTEAVGNRRAVGAQGVLVGAQGVGESGLGGAEVETHDRRAAPLAEQRAPGQHHLGEQVTQRAGCCCLHAIPFSPHGQAPDGWLAVLPQPTSASPARVRDEKPGFSPRPPARPTRRTGPARTPWARCTSLAQHQRGEQHGERRVERDHDRGHGQVAAAAGDLNSPVASAASTPLISPARRGARAAARAAAARRRPRR